MRFRTVPLTEVSPDDLARWRYLADTAIEPNPNTDPRFLYTSLGFGLFAEEIHLAIVESGDEFAAVMPYTLARRLSGAPVRHASTSGEFMFDHASKNHPLVCRQESVAAFRSLFEGLRTSGVGDLVNLTVFPADGPLWDALQKLLATGTLRVVERARDRRAYALRADLDPTGADWKEASGIFDYPMPHMSGRKRRNLRKCARQIEELAGGVLTISERTGDQETIEEFLELQATGWKGDAGKAGPQFRRRGREAWFRSVVAAFGEDGLLRTWRVRAGEETVYIHINLSSGGHLFGFHDVYSERFAPFSPGAVGRVAHLGALLSSPEAAPFDPGMEPTYVQAGALYPSSREYVDLLVSGGSWRSRTVVSVFPAAKRMRALARTSAARANR